MLITVEDVTTINVAAGIITNTEGMILVALRPQEAELGGYWEFPGGKVEPNESIEQALYRELAEEVAIEVLAAQAFIQIEHLYPNKRKIILHVYKVERFAGEAFGKEGQALRWVTLNELSTLQFPAANQAIVDALKAQARYHKADTK